MQYSILVILLCALTVVQLVYAREFLTKTYAEWNSSPERMHSRSNDNYANCIRPILTDGNRYWNPTKNASPVNVSIERILHLSFHDYFDIRLVKARVGRVQRRNLDLLASLWMDNTVPYEFDKSTYGNSLDDVKSAVEAVIQKIHENSCLRLIPRSNEENYVKFIGNADDCKSTVGMSSPTEFYVTGKCSLYGILHEMMHALGFDHEQSRSDRYGKIKIQWNKIDKNDLSQYEYENTKNQYPFDYHSILLYNTEDITIPDKSLEYLQDHEKNEFPFYDRAEINAAYKCAGGCGLTCQNGGFAMKSGSTCSCSCPDGLTGSDCSELSSSCGEIIELKDGQSKVIKEQGNNNMCTWLIKGQTRVRATVNIINLPTISGKDDCSNWLEIKDYLIGDPGKKLCGSKHGAVFTKMLIGDPSTMMIRYVGEAESSQSSNAFSLTVESFDSGCATFPCTHGSTCVDGASPGSYTCDCVSGFSGRNCDIISASSTTKCDFEDDLAPCIFSQETSKSDFRWNIHADTFGEDRIGEFQYLSIRPFQNIDYGSKTILVTNVSFEEADRCLTFSYAFEKYQPPSDDKTRFDVIYEGSDFPTRKMYSSVMKDGYTKWKTVKINLPATKNAKITLQGELWTEKVGIDNIILTPGLCGTPCLETNPCLNDGQCEPQGSKYTCICQDGFSGRNCQIREGFLCGFEEEEEESCTLKPSKDANFEWTRWKGRTPTSRTGPMTAHGGDYFMYIEQNPWKKEARKEGEKAVLVSSNVFKENSYCLTFYYHMYDEFKSDMGSLKIKTKKGDSAPKTEWEKRKNQGNEWLKAKVDLELDSNTKVKERKERQ